MSTPTHPGKPGAGAYGHGCRCPECTEAHRVRQRKVLAELAGRPRDQVPHGPHGYSNWGCRCETCSAAHSEVNALARASRKTAAGKPLSAMEAAALRRAQARGAVA